MSAPVPKWYAVHYQLNNGTTGIYFTSWLNIRQRCIGVKKCTFKGEKDVESAMGWFAVTLNVLGTGPTSHTISLSLQGKNIRSKPQSRHAHIVHANHLSDSESFLQLKSELQVVGKPRVVIECRKQKFITSMCEKEDLFSHRITRGG